MSNSSTKDQPPLITWDIESMTEEEVVAALEGILRATDDVSAQQEHSSYEHIAAFFSEAHDKRVAALIEEKKGLILDLFMENPAESFRVEFLQLKQIYKDRMVTYRAHHLVQSATSAFCLQDHRTNSVDYLFEEYETPAGNPILKVEKAFSDDQVSYHVSVKWQDNELKVERRHYAAGSYQYEVLEGEVAVPYLAQIFSELIKASADQMRCNADDRENSDLKALKLIKQTEQARHVVI